MLENVIVQQHCTKQYVGIGFAATEVGGGGGGGCLEASARSTPGKSVYDMGRQEGNNTCPVVWVT